MAKSPEAFRTISEVAEWLDVPTHVLRFWESRFSQVKPVKRAGGRRYYRPADMELLGGIKRLLHDDGLTIRGVQKLLREEGVRHVAALAPPLKVDEGAPPAEGANVVTLRAGATPAHPAPSPEEATADAPPASPPSHDIDVGTLGISAEETLRVETGETQPPPAAASPILDEEAVYVPGPGPITALLRLSRDEIARRRDRLENALDRARALKRAMDRADG